VRNHTKIYFKALGYDLTDFVASEISGAKAVDIHHIDCKGMGGDPTNSKNRIENLQAVTREEHIHFGDKTEHMAFLYEKHYEFLEANGVKFNKQYILDKIEKYKLCSV
jgi:hypothetical protein